MSRCRRGSSPRARAGRTQIMERVNITIGSLSFDHADYDADSDVLYLHIGEPAQGEGETTAEGMLSATRRVPIV
jgi:hypothetical protein